MSQSPPTTSKALVVPGRPKRKRRSGWQILKDMWDNLWIWGHDSRERLTIDQFGHTEVDGTRRSQRIASLSRTQGLIKDK